MGIGNIATTGMQAAMGNMEVISNNIANSNTYAYKGSFINFADIYPSGTGSNTQAGLGVSISSIQQSFKAGGPVPTNNAKDLCIQKNNGFFILSDASTGQASYTRYGRFNFDNGYLMMGNSRLQGFPAVDGSIPAGGVPKDIFIDTSPQMANASTTVAQQGVNLKSNSDVPATSTFSTADTTSYNFSSPATVYDSLGNENQLMLYYVKTATPNEWTVHAYMNGSSSSLGTGTLTFSTAGKLLSTTGLSSLSFTTTSGAASPQEFSVDMTGATQVASDYTSKAFTTDGYKAGTYVDYGIDKDGKINIAYSNGKSVLAGQIALATFLAPSNLQNMGDMSWTATGDSGAATISQSYSENSLIGSNLEMSNVDLASEMVNLITAQNIFQANAQVQQVYDQVMQTVTKL